VSAALPVDYTMMAEFLPSDRRGRWLVLLESFWAIGTICLAVLALVALSHGDQAWRVIFLVTGIPALIGVVLRFYIPESPMYLNRSGRSDGPARYWNGWRKQTAETSRSRPCNPKSSRRSRSSRCSPERSAAAASRYLPRGR
jgi:MFS family permease